MAVQSATIYGIYFPRILGANHPLRNVHEVAVPIYIFCLWFVDSDVDPGSKYGTAAFLYIVTNQVELTKWYWNPQGSLADSKDQSPLNLCNLYGT